MIKDIIQENLDLISKNDFEKSFFPGYRKKQRKGEMHEEDQAC